MKITLTDLRRNPQKILDALASNKTITLTRYGTPFARFEPSRKFRPSASSHKAFGLWADRPDLQNPPAWIRRQRRSRSTF